MRSSRMNRQMRTANSRRLLTRFLGCLMVLFVSLGSGARAASPRACAVASFAVGALLADRGSARPMVLTSKPARMVGPPPSLADFTHRFDKAEDAAFGWVGESPAPELAKAFLAEKAVSPLLICPAFDRRLAALKVSTDERALNRIRRRSAHSYHRIESYGVRIISMSLPIVSADGLHALIGVDSTYGPLDGTGSIFLFELGSNGQWTLIGQLRTWIS